jgi:hypothetical protein
MAHKQTRHRSHADTVAGPVARWTTWNNGCWTLSPSLLARQLELRDPRRPDRLIRMRQRP